MRSSQQHRRRAAALITATLVAGLVAGWILSPEGANLHPGTGPRQLGQVGGAVAVGSQVEVFAKADTNPPDRAIVHEVEVADAGVRVECVMDGAGDPVSGASVDVARIDVDPPVTMSIGETDSNGLVVATGLPPGTYAVQVSHGSMIPIAKISKPITLQPASEATVRIVLARMYVAVLTFGDGEKPYDVRFDVPSRPYEDVGIANTFMAPTQARLLGEYGPYFRLCAARPSVAGVSMVERFYLFFEHYPTQAVDVPLVSIDEFVEPTKFDCRLLHRSGAPAPKIMLHTIDSRGDMIDAGRWMLLREAPVFGLESVDVVSNQWRNLPDGRYRLRGHALRCPWVFGDTQEIEVVEGGEYDVVIAANCPHRSCVLSVRREGQTLPGSRGRLTGVDAAGRKYAGLWMDVSGDLNLDLPVGRLGLEVMHEGRTSAFDLVVADQPAQKIAVELNR